MKRMKRNGNCVYTTAEPATIQEWLATRPGATADDANHGAIVVRQRGNGSVRLVYPIPKAAGGGAFRPFVFPSPYKPHKSYPLNARGVDPRDIEATAASRRAYGL